MTTTAIASRPQAHDSAAPTAPRLDLYAPIHKALRSFMSDTLVRVGRIDVADAEDMHSTLA